MSFKLTYYYKRLGILGLLAKTINRIFHKRIDLYYISYKHYYSKLDPNLYEKELKEWYRIYRNRGPEDVDNPKTFSDKIQWLKIHDNNALRAICADKYLVRGYLESLSVKGLHLVPMIGSWKDPNSIDFDSLPDSFVLKQSAGSKMNLIIPDKNSVDVKKVKRTLSRWMSVTYGFNGMEFQYLNSPKRIIAETYMSEFNGDLLDYKLFCFHGEPKFIEVIGERGITQHGGRVAFFDLQWKRYKYRTTTYAEFETTPSKPDNLSDMIEIAKVLSEPFIFVRVDLYNIDGKIYFGELTFSPTNGIAQWNPKEGDSEIGKMLHLKC